MASAACAADRFDWLQTRPTIPKHATNTIRQVAINTRWAMILPFIASNQSRRAMAAGLPNRSIARRRASPGFAPRSSSRL